MRVDPTLADDLAAVRQIEAAYRRLGGEAMADLAAARRQTAGDRTDAADAIVRRAMARHAAGDGGTAAPSRRRVLAAAAALFVVALAVLAWPRHDADGPHVPTHLGGGGPAGLEPRGEVAALTAFSWSVPTALGRTFVVRVRDRAAPGQYLLQSPELDASPWQAPPEQLARLPAAFDWQLVVRDVDGLETTYDAAVTVRH